MIIETCAPIMMFLLIVDNIFVFLKHRLGSLDQIIHVNRSTLMNCIAALAPKLLVDNHAHELEFFSYYSAKNIAWWLDNEF